MVNLVFEICQWLESGTDIVRLIDLLLVKRATTNYINFV